MNKIIRLIIAAFIIFGVLAAPTAARAEAQHIPVTGTCWIEHMGGYDGFPNDPDYRWWPKPNETGSHWRYQMWYIGCDYDVDLLDGKLVTVDNWNDNTAQAQTHAYGYSAGEDWTYNGLWDGHSTGVFDWGTGFMTIKAEFTGHGIYQGYLFKCTWESTPEGYYLVEGELLIPGGE